MKTKHRVMSISKCETLSRLFAALDFQIATAIDYGRNEDANAMSRIKGKLLAAHFGFERTCFDEPAEGEQ